VRGGGFGRRGGTGFERDDGMEAKPHTPVDFESRAALRVWCILAGLALAPLPAFHALPEGFLIYLFESPPPGWTRLFKGEIIVFTFLGLPLAPIFLAWAFPGVGRSGLPKRAIVVLCFLVAYNPLRYFFERYIYGEMVARMVVVFDQSSVAGWTVRHLDTPLLIGLVAAALLRRHTLRPLPKIMFHWTLFVCALWAAGPPLLDRNFYGLTYFQASVWRTILSAG
jgi:hypothetical protein